jgi:hypothetical protein
METNEPVEAPKEASRYPLAFDGNGNPIDIPATAVAWRVRRGGGRRGRPRNVFDAETGRQLEVPLGSTLNELIEAGCPADRYLLYPVDAEGRIIPGIVAITEILDGATETEEPDAATAAADKQSMQALLYEQMRTIAKQSETMCRALEATTSGYGQVRPIIPQPTPVIVEAPAPPEESSSGFKPEQIAEFMGMAKMFFDALKGGGAPAGGAT